MNGQPKNDFLESLLVIIVIYEMEIEKSPAYVSLSKAVEATRQPVSLFIYDNSFDPHQCPQSSIWRIEYCHDASNPGVSRAYNEGLKKAKAQNKKWMLLVDQDTIFPIDFFDKTQKSRDNDSQQELFVPMVNSKSTIISPFHFRFGRGKVIDNVNPGNYSIIEAKFINSGVMITTALFEKCGGYDERFPLDFSDLVFSERVKKYQNNITIVDVVCNHSLSSDETSRVKALNRFHYFLRASRLYGKIVDRAFSLFVNRVLRTLNLSVQYRSLDFVRMFIRTE